MLDLARRTSLRARGLRKQFGGVTAVADVSLDVRMGEIHAVIGPNGAGKSTLINLLAGELYTTSGSIWLDDRDVTFWRPDRRARAGLGRAYQKTTLFPDFSVLENVRLAAQASGSSPLRVFGSARADAVLLGCARTAITKAGLGGREALLARALSHGEQRQLEIAMVLATEPHVVLLDEPLAGMGLSEARDIIALIASLKADRAILLVEHDMDAVFKLADRLTVMQDGRVIASGLPEEVRHQPAVRTAYLGNPEAFE